MQYHGAVIFEMPDGSQKTAVFAFQSEDEPVKVANVEWELWVSPAAWRPPDEEREPPVIGAIEEQEATTGELVSGKCPICWQPTTGTIMPTDTRVKLSCSCSMLVGWARKIKS